MKRTAMVDGRRNIIWSPGDGTVGHRPWRWWSPADLMRLVACRLDRR